MNVLLAYTCQTGLEEKYYGLLRDVMDIIYTNNHKIYLGGLSYALKDTLPKYADAIVCYSVEKYKSEIENCPNCNYILVQNSFERTKILLEETDCVIITPGGTGTIAEFYTILEEYRTIEAKKKLYVLNLDGHYDTLLHSIRDLVAKGFNKEDIFNYIEEIDIAKLKEIMKEGK